MVTVPYFFGAVFFYFSRRGVTGGFYAERTYFSKSAFCPDLRLFLFLFF